MVSGQQAGLFAGPLYTIYKALSAVKLAACMTQRGIKAVPVFWIATEDHDFAEVTKAEFINRDCALGSVSVPAEIHPDGSPVGRVTLDESITGTVQSALEALPKTEFSEDLEKLASDDPNIESVYYPGLPDHDGHEVHRRQANGDGGILAVDLGGLRERERKLRRRHPQLLCLTVEEAIAFARQDQIVQDIGDDNHHQGAEGGGRHPGEPP